MPWKLFKSHGCNFQRANIQVFLNICDLKLLKLEVEREDFEEKGYRPQAIRGRLRWVYYEQATNHKTKPCSFSVPKSAVHIVYFLSFFSPFTKKTLTNFNIQGTCFGNYKGLPSAENTYIFYENTHNFYKVTNNFSDSPRNFTDFPAIFDIKTVEIPRFTRVSPLPYYKDNKFSGEMQIR